MRNVRKVRILRFLTFLSTDFNIPAWHAGQWTKEENAALVLLDVDGER